MKFNIRHSAPYAVGVVTILKRVIRVTGCTILQQLFSPAWPRFCAPTSEYETLQSAELQLK